MKEELPALINECNDLVSLIREMIVESDLLNLLTFSHITFLGTLTTVESECELDPGLIADARFCEYVQSVIASTKIKSSAIKRTSTEEFSEILVKFEELYNKMQLFYIYYTDYLQDNGTLSEKDAGYFIEEQCSFVVRGNRYPCLQIEYFEHLLMIHSDEFVQMYDIDALEVLNGIRKMENALSQGVVEELNSILEESSEKLNSEFYEKTVSCFKYIFGCEKNEVSAITGWPEKLIDDLTFDIGEDQTFFSGKFAGWPIVDLPIQKKPFIRINDTAYCFDYYSFVDNIYRCLQKAISNGDPEYSWKDKQSVASEKMVADIFSELLPGCSIYRNNYYPIGSSIKRLAENDLLIVYEDVLLVVEVKAGGFIYTSPFIDLENHVESYRTLLEKASQQCQRVKEYIYNCDKSAVFFDEKKHEKKVIPTDSFSDIFCFSITVDNINTLANKAHKLEFLNVGDDVICIGVDDLLVYKNYFDSPLCFMHFIKQRCLAAKANMNLNDELDHLGLYICKNCYPMYADSLRDYDQMFFSGFRYDLDLYFGRLHHPELKIEKPSLPTTLFFKELVDLIEKSKSHNKVFASSYLLSFSGEAQEDIEEKIRYILKRQREIKRCVPLTLAGNDDSLRCTIFVNQPEIPTFDDCGKQKYVLSRMIYNDEPDRTAIVISVDDNDDPVDILVEKYTPDNLSCEEKEELLKEGKKNADKMLAYHIQKNGKIGRNEMCPCGSGKKYKKCCGKN